MKHGWLLGASGLGAVALALFLLSLNRSAALLATLLLVLGAWGVALWRSGRLVVLARKRALQAAALLLLFIATQFVLHLHPVFTVLLLLALGIGLLLVRIRQVDAQHWQRIIPLLESRRFRWLSFAAITALLIYWLTLLPAPYPLLILGIMLLGALVLLYAQRIGADTRAALARAATLVAVLLAVLGAYALKNLESLTPPLLILLLGLAALSVSIYLQRRSGLLIRFPEPSAAEPTPLQLARRDHIAFGLGLLLWLLFTEASGRLLDLPLIEHMHVHVQFALMLLSLGLMVTGYLGLWSQGLRWPRIAWRLALLVGLVTLLAFGLRFYALESGLRQFLDEVSFASAVDGFWDRADVSLTEAMNSFAAFPNIYPYWQTMTVDLFGHNMLGLRTVSALLGTVTIPALYLLGRWAFDHKTGLLAALLLATFPPHLHFSRIALNNIADPFFGTLALAFLMRGLRGQRRLDYLLGGLLLGLTHYFYEGGRLLFTALAAAWLIGLAYLWFPRLRWRQIVPAAIMTLLVALPIYYTLAVNRSSVVARLDYYEQALDGRYWDRIVSSPDGLLQHINGYVLRPVLVIFRDFEGSVFYQGAGGLVPPALLPLVFLGLGLVALRLRSPGPLLLLGWFSIEIAGNSVMFAPDHTSRYVLVFPALMLLAAVGLRYLWPLITPRRGRWLILSLLALGLAAYQADFYFNQHLPLFKQQLYQSKIHPDGGDMLFRSVDFPPETAVHVISDPPDDERYVADSLHFLRDDLTLRALKPEDVTLDYLASLRPGVDQAFFIEAGQDALLSRIQQYYYLLPPQYSPYDDVPREYQFLLYYSPYLGDYSDEKRAPLGLPPDDSP